MPLNLLLLLLYTTPNTITTEPTAAAAATTSTTADVASFATSVNSVEALVGFQNQSMSMLHAQACQSVVNNTQAAVLQRQSSCCVAQTHVYGGVDVHGEDPSVPPSNYVVPPVNETSNVKMMISINRDMWDAVGNDKMD